MLESISYVAYRTVTAVLVFERSRSLLNNTAFPSVGDKEVGQKKTKEQRQQLCSARETTLRGAAATEAVKVVAAV